MWQNNHQTTKTPTNKPPEKFRRNATVARLGQGGEKNKNTHTTYPGRSPQDCLDTSPRLVTNRLQYCAWIRTATSSRLALAANFQQLALAANFRQLALAANFRQLALAANFQHLALTTKFRYLALIAKIRWERTRSCDTRHRATYIITQEELIPTFE